MIYLIMAAYTTILFSEILGDKSIFTISSLSARSRPLYVMCGASLGFACKMLVAVLMGSTIFTAFPPELVCGLSVVSFFATAIYLWFKRSENRSQESQQRPDWPRSILFAFAAIFFSEWGDVGQLTAANLVARYNAPFTIFVGGTAALVTKGILATTLGVGLRKRIRTESLRYLACGLCILMGILSFFTK